MNYSWNCKFFCNLMVKKIFKSGLSMKIITFSHGWIDNFSRFVNIFLMCKVSTIKTTCGGEVA